MSDNNMQLVTTQQSSLQVFQSADNFAHGQRMAQALSSSSLVPESFRGNMPNCLIALELSGRLGASPFMIMQNLDIIEGKPSLNSKYAIAAANNCGRFTPIRWKMRDLGMKEVEYTFWDGPKGSRTKKTGKLKIQNKGWKAYATDINTKEVLEGPEVTLEMAVLEGWYTKAGSKWVTMPDMMGQYRSAKFFVNMYAPEVLMGFPTTDEILDTRPEGEVTVEAIPIPSASEGPKRGIKNLTEKLKAEQNTTAAPAEGSQPAATQAHATDDKNVTGSSNGQAASDAGEVIEATVIQDGDDEGLLD